MEKDESVRNEKERKKETDPSNPKFGPNNKQFNPVFHP